MGHSGPRQPDAELRLGVDRRGARPTRTTTRSVVRADTYNDQPTGNFGTQVPGFVPAQDGVSAAGPNKRLVIPRVVQSADPTTGYRTNLSFFLLSGHDGHREGDVLREERAFRSRSIRSTTR